MTETTDTAKAQGTPGTPVSLYVAGKFDDRDEIHKKINAFREDGYKITHDWTQVEGLGDSSSSDNQSPYHAHVDLEGVKNANMVVMIMDDFKYAYRGSFTELGAALALHKRVLLYNPHHAEKDPKKQSYSMSNVFYWHPYIIHFTEWDKLVAYLKDFTSLL